MIYTSYFANLKKLPDNVIPIAICGGVPQWYKGLCYKKVAPRYKFFMEWKKNHDNAFYIEHFQKEVLDILDPVKVVSDLQSLVPEEVRAQMTQPIWENPDWHIALICYEKPSDFCHRHLVADWLMSNGYKVKEYEI